MVVLVTSIVFEISDVVVGDIVCGRYALMIVGLIRFHGTSYFAIFAVFLHDYVCCN